MPINTSNRLLISPLDWGLGHTSRCIPIIYYLLQLGREITFAGNEWQRDFITRTFPGLDTVHLDGYNVKYNMQGSGLAFSVLAQAPSILNSIKKEHEWLKKLQRERHFDAIISDNRYGLYHPEIPSVILTHQLEIQTGFGNSINKLLRKLHYKLLNRFSECWVPDALGSANLSGNLGHPAILPDNTKYIGCLSQFQKSCSGSPEAKSILVLLSGLEPQRSTLSAILWEQLKQFGGKVTFVEGTNGAKSPESIPPHISYHKQLTKDLLLPLLQQADIIIARSGYSSIMDLTALGKKAILIPTPGQTEQEYLGTYLHQHGVFYCAPQKNFALRLALKEAETFPFSVPLPNDAFNLHQPIIDYWLSSSLSQ